MIIVDDNIWSYHSSVCVEASWTLRWEFCYQWRRNDSKRKVQPNTAVANLNIFRCSCRQKNSRPSIQLEYDCLRKAQAVQCHCWAGMTTKMSIFLDIERPADIELHQLTIPRHDTFPVIECSSSDINLSILKVLDRCSWGIEAQEGLFISPHCFVMAGSRDFIQQCSRSNTYLTEMSSQYKRLHL